MPRICEWCGEPIAFFDAQTSSGNAAWHTRCWNHAAEQRAAYIAECEDCEGFTRRPLPDELPMSETGSHRSEVIPIMATAPAAPNNPGSPRSRGVPTQRSRNRRSQIPARENRKLAVWRALHVLARRWPRDVPRPRGRREDRSPGHQRPRELHHHPQVGRSRNRLSRGKSRAWRANNPTAHSSFRPCRRKRRHSESQTAGVSCRSQRLGSPEGRRRSADRGEPTRWSTLTPQILDRTLNTYQGRIKPEEARSLLVTAYIQRSKLSFAA